MPKATLIIGPQMRRKPVFPALCTSSVYWEGGTRVKITGSMDPCVIYIILTGFNLGHIVVETGPSDGDESKFWTTNYYKHIRENAILLFCVRPVTSGKGEQT